MRNLRFKCAKCGKLLNGKYKIRTNGGPSVDVDFSPRTYEEKLCLECYGEPLIEKNEK